MLFQRKTRKQPGGSTIRPRCPWLGRRPSYIAPRYIISITRQQSDPKGVLILSWIIFLQQQQVKLTNTFSYETTHARCLVHAQPWARWIRSSLDCFIIDKCSLSDPDAGRLISRFSTSPVAIRQLSGKFKACPSFFPASLEKKTLTQQE
jgi:hypothetical protein